MREDSISDVGIQVMDRRFPAGVVDDARVLRVMRESLRKDPPAVRFVPQSKRYLGFFH